MKIAIICDWLVSVGGAEKVLCHILKCFPDADIFSLVDFLPSDKRDIVHNKSVKTSFIQKLPWAKTKYRSYLFLMPLAIEQFDLAEYDLIISSSHAIAKGVITSPDQLHICYCHSPIRYAWDLQHQYLHEANLERGFKSWLARFILHKIRIWDLRTVNGVDHFIANSSFIAKRIYKIYRRSATVIYPPVVTSVDIVENKRNYYVTASRMVPYKKVELIVKAFAQMPDKELVIIGDGPDLAKIRELSIGHSNIQILGYVTDTVLREYLANAKAFVFAAREDFGMLLVEAQAFGTPVITYGSGGATDIIVSNTEDLNTTGVFFDRQTSDSIVEAVNYFETNLQISPKDCHNNAARFDEEIFSHEFKLFVLDKFNQFKQNQ